MINIFIMLIIIGAFLMWPKEKKYFRGYKEIRAWWIDFFSKIICTIGWFGVIFQSRNWEIDDSKEDAVTIMVIAAIFFVIFFRLICYVVSDIELILPVMKDIKEEKMNGRVKEKIPYRVVKNMYLMHPESFSWEERFYPVYQKVTFRMSSIDLLRFSFLYSEKVGNKEISNLMLKELEKDMIKIQEDKEKSILMVNKASKDLANIMAEMRDNK